MEKEPCTKFCGVLIIISHEVMKLQSFEFDVIEVTLLIPANVKDISSLVFFNKEIVIRTIVKSLIENVENE